MEDLEEKGWIAWRNTLVEAVNDLVARFPSIRESRELADLKTMLETGPILIDREKFKKALRFH
jgi:hypothetical protein